MYAVIGRVKIHSGHEDETLSMIVDGGVAMVRACPARPAGTGREPSPDGNDPQGYTEHLRVIGQGR
jgi:hypothetical protein